MVQVAAIVLAALFASGASAQDPEARAGDPPAAPAAALPKGPVPYSAIAPKAGPKPKPAAAKPAGTTASTTTGAATAPEGPVTAGAVATLGGLPTTAAGARLARNQVIPAGELEAFVDGYVKAAMAREHIAGVTVSVVQNGAVVLKKGYGFAALDPQRKVDPDRTLFRVGSISKTFTWIALMKEVEAGRIRLDAPVNLYLPEKVRVRDQGYSTDVRVTNLMDHSAGFEDRALGQLFEENFDRVRPMDLYLRQERPRRVHEPGAISSYSNYGATLAGQAVVYVTGRPFERLMEDEIFTPLGMKNTTFREPHPEKKGIPGAMPEALAAEVSEAYRWTPTGFERRNFEYIGQVAPAGSVSSTAGDMARYMLMQLGGGQLNGVTVYSPKSAQAFRTPLRNTPPGINGWAHGFAVYTLPGGWRGYGHDGGTLSFNSNMVVIPDLSLGIFLSANTETAAGFVHRLPNAVVQQFYAAPQTFPRPGSPELKSAAGTFSGYYVGTRRAYSGLEGFIMRLRSGVNVGVTGDGKLALTGGGQTSTYAPDGEVSEGRFIGVPDDSRLAFTFRDGRARTFIGSGGSVLYQRAGFWKQPTTLSVLTALAAAAAAATLVGVLFRNRREFRENVIQARASLVQNIQAGLWLLAFVMFGLWVSRTGDLAHVMYGWPGALLITASASALVAAGLTITTIVALPAIWRGGRRVDSWTHLRKGFFTFTVIVYALFAWTLWTWGALSPWSG